MQHHLANPANSNTRFTHAPVDVALAMSRRAAQAQRSAEEARRFYAENVTDDVAAGLRASPDFAPAFAEPGEMAARESREEKLAERGFLPILIGLGIAALAVAIVLMTVALTRGNA